MPRLWPLPVDLTQQSSVTPKLKQPLVVASFSALMGSPPSEEIEARIAELKAEYQQLQDDYGDEVLLCMGLLRALINADYGFCEALVKRADCSAERKTDALRYIADARAGSG